MGVPLNEDGGGGSSSLDEAMEIGQLTVDGMSNGDVGSPASN
jgi:hypothetical protein